MDRGVVYITERCRSQVFPECHFWVVFNSVQFYLSRQLAQENHGIVESKEKRELCMHLLDSSTDYIKIMRQCLISLFNKNTGHVNVNSITGTPVFHQCSAWRKS